MATPNCPLTREEVYVAGSEPTQLCEVHGGHSQATSSGGFLSHIFGGGSPKPPVQASVDANGNPIPADTQAAGQDDQTAKSPEKKKNAFQRIFGIFGDKKKKDPEKPPRDKGDSP